MRKKIGIIILVVVLFIIGGISILLWKPSPLPTNIIAIRSVTVNENIHIKGMLAASYLFFKGYDISYNNGNLYITIMGNILNINRASGNFDFSIPVNEYGEINKIYLTNHTSEANLLIWSKP